jgi:hypothetical protein
MPNGGVGEIMTLPNSGLYGDVKHVLEEIQVHAFGVGLDGKLSTSILGEGRVSMIDFSNSSIKLLYWAKIEHNKQYLGEIKGCYRQSRIPG